MILIRLFDEMTTNFNLHKNNGLPATLGSQINGPDMDVRPRIRRRVPNIRSPLTSVTKTASTSSLAHPRTNPSPTRAAAVFSRTDSGLNAQSKTDSGIRNPSRTGSGHSRTNSAQSRSNSAQQRPDATQNRKGGGLKSNKGRNSKLHNQRPTYENVKHDHDLGLDLEDDGQGQDVRFFDVGSSDGTSSSSRLHTARDIQTIAVTDILERCQESSPDKVYEIDIHASQIAVIENLERFTKVRVLDLSCNYIQVIENLHLNVDLREMKLYDNEIENIENLDRLKEICSLQLQHNKIKAIGKGLQNLRKLKVLRLDSNSLCRLEVREFASCAQLTTLDLSNNKLDNIAAVSCLTSLEELYVINNRLRTVADLSRCKKLQEIDVSYNKITDLSGLKGLASLTILHASNNKVTTMKAIGKLKGLQELNLSNNRMTELSHLVDYYPALEILDVCDNHIETWPEVLSLSRLPELVELYVSGNPFCSSDNGQMPRYHAELAKVLTQLDILDGAHMKKLTARVTTPLMRPMSASSVVTSRQVETQLKCLDDEMMSFEESLSKRFESLRSTMEYLPKEGTSRPSTSADNLTPVNIRPTSRSSKRSRIKLAQEFATQQYLHSQSAGAQKLNDL